MGFREWWRNKSGKAKTIAVLCALLILQIGLCFGTNALTSLFPSVFHIRPSYEPYDTLTYMLFEALLCVITAIVLFAVSSRPLRKRAAKEKENYD